MWKQGASFATVVAQSTGVQTELQRFMRRSNESVSVYFSRLKKEIDTHASKPFAVFNVKCGNASIDVAARNEYVARFIAYQQHTSALSQRMKLAEEKYVSFALSNNDESWDLGLDDDVDVNEASHVARSYFRSQNQRNVGAEQNEWARARVSRTDRLLNTEGHV